ncbi:hypothetical protein HK099_005937 [Clydaea vesicula]|uniref:IQCH-like ATP-grasp domain-containing protein n=1 Tax=Clydaea vesicula TaxID=447962 RepID=A0AAD5XUK4_9FUNG|nr:hypothetical protein HK099_005937 [Clydaea vesicula]
MLSHKANHKNSNKNLKNSKNFQPNKLEQNISSESDFLKDQLFTEKNKDVIIVPSLSLDSHLLSEINGLIHYESRLLYNILSLRYQSNRLFYFSSIQIDPAIIDYYFELIKENLEDLQEAKNRFFLISVNDFRNNLCLSHKLLLRPNLLTHVASLLRKDDKSVASDLKVFRGTAYEEKIAEKFALDLNSTKGKDLDWGGKAGSRTIFKELNIPHIPGTYTAEKNLESFFKSIIDVLKNNPNAKKGIVKLDQGFSGKGNATMNVEETNKILHSTEDKEANVEKALVALKKAYLNLKFSCESETIENFTNSLKHLGAIFELFYDTRAKDPKLVTSPSVQVLIKNDLTVITLSTHEQILEGHCYTGCRYPCNEDYREELEKFGKKVGQFLAKKKIADYFSVDL